MPELPEVETVRRGLEQKIIGRKILLAQVLRKQTITKVDCGQAGSNNESANANLVKAFEAALQGQVFKKIERRAKYLFLIMQSGLTVTVHLKMTGSFLYQPKTEARPIHTHVVFELDNGYELRFKDLRAFGRMQLHSSLNSALEEGSIPKLAPEPINDKFSLPNFRKALKKYSSQIKPLLLDQSKLVSGVGNIYADESLFLSGILPSRPANEINDKESQNLFEAIKKVISESIELGGSSIRDYVKVDESLGHYALNLFVYGRKKENCKVCKTPLSYIRLAQRGTHFCPSCQK